MKVLEELSFDEISLLKKKYSKRIDKICIHCSSPASNAYYSNSKFGYFLQTLCDKCYEVIYFKDESILRKVSEKERFMFLLDEI